jgi:Inner membrane component of T3SS, cytoplasmic domain
MTAAAQRSASSNDAQISVPMPPLSGVHPATDPQPPPTQASPSPGTRVLRILTGPHTGAESELQSERLLVGNLESECDIVIDVRRPERHICLVRASSDGWTVLGIAGDLWVGEEYLEAPHTRDIASGTVITLGRVAFCVADSATIDWASLQPPLALVKPEAAGPMPSAALPPAPEVKLRKWHATKLAAGVGIAALTMISAGAYLAAALAVKAPTAEEAASRMKAQQTMVSALPFGKEVQLAPDPTNPNRVLVQGYLPKRDQLPALERALRDAEIAGELHLATQDDLGKDLVRRFDRIKPDAIAYEDNGRFSIRSHSEVLDVHDRQARQTLQEVPALSGLNLLVADLQAADGKPIVVRYDRAADRPSDIVVSEIDVIRQRQRIVVREQRGGALPSIVLDNGVRYFEGATLPDKTVLKRIEPTQLVVMQGSGERVIPLSAQAPASSPR